MSFAVIIYRSNFSMMVGEAFEITPKTIGQIISYGSIASAISGMCTGRIVKFYGDRKKLLLHSSIAQTLTIAGLTFSPSLPIFMVFITCLSMENSVSRVCMTDMSVRRSGADNTGALMGLSASLMSTSRAIAPFIAGVTQEVSNRGPGVIGILSGLIGCVCIVTMLQSDDSSGAEMKDAGEKKED